MLRFQKCLEFNRGILEKSEEMVGLERLILAARWPVYVETTRPENDNLTVLYADAEASNSKDGSGNPTVVRENLSYLANTMRKRGVAVTILGTAPELDWDVRDRLAASILFNVALPDPMTRAEMQKRQGRTNALLEDIAATHEAEFVPIGEQLCNPVCPTHDETAIYYRDTHHLTPTGARHLLTELLAMEMLEPLDQTEAHSLPRSEKKN